jgi:hypothetical protein
MMLRKANKVALVGFAPGTRDHAPYDDPEYDIWTVNEAGAFDFVKRIDVLFQIHPRWDFTRDANGNDPNHWLWLQNSMGRCNVCLGTGKLAEDKCPMCENGTYYPRESRKNVRAIVMQEQHDDIPDSVAYPLKEMIAKNPMGKYFTSSLAYMLFLAHHLGYEEIMVVGFEMGAQTEYFYQRSNAEYLIGYLQGLGQKFMFPENTSLMKGELYAYENMRTGYRQQLDMRIANLTNQLNRENHNLAKTEGSMQTWKILIEKGVLPPESGAEFKTVQEMYAKQIGLVNLIKGALAETENLKSLYDRYFVVGENHTSRMDTVQHVDSAYKA